MERLEDFAQQGLWCTIIDLACGGGSCGGDCYECSGMESLIDLEIQIDDLGIAYMQQLVKEWANDQPTTDDKVKPTIVCLCGSTRFVDAFNQARVNETMKGKIVLSIEITTSQHFDSDPQYSNLPVKRMLDELHLRKIDLADEILVLNVGGYVGESTSREITYAKEQGKTIRWLEG